MVIWLHLWFLFLFSFCFACGCALYSDSMLNILICTLCCGQHSPSHFLSFGLCQLMWNILLPASLCSPASCGSTASAMEQWLHVHNIGDSIWVIQVKVSERETSAEWMIYPCSQVFILTLEHCFYEKCLRHCFTALILLLGVGMLWSGMDPLMLICYPNSAFSPWARIRGAQSNFTKQFQLLPCYQIPNSLMGVLEMMTNVTMKRGWYLKQNNDQYKDTSDTHWAGSRGTGWMLSCGPQCAFFTSSGIKSESQWRKMIHKELRLS